MTETIAVVGGGINGLVAANYLRRAGADVHLYELRDRVGGACISETITIDGVRYDFPLGATVLGLMQDFIFDETGLAECLEIWAPTHSKVVHFAGAKEPVYIHRDPDELDRELRLKCGENGDVAGFRRDEARVVDFLRKGFRSARPPRLNEAREALGPTLSSRFIEGSARALLDHYFSSDQTKLYMGMTVIESGPVSLDAPFSAFNIPLLDSGTIFDGYYGFVRGGIWRITEELARINEELGIRIETSTRIDSLDGLDAKTIVLATDPVTAAELTGRVTSKQQLLGTSGKLTLLFRDPVRWKDAPEASTAFRFIFFNENLEAMDRAAQRVVEENIDFEPGYLQIYCDGAGMRAMGEDEPFERVIAFTKNLRFDRSGDELADAERWVRDAVLSKIDNPEALAWSKLLTPKDLKDRFLFPEGNVDHTMMTDGQNFSERHFSSDPEASFYRFGEADNIYYCGAGSYPCGSVAGTNGFMCAREITRRWA